MRELNSITSSVRRSALTIAAVALVSGCAKHAEPSIMIQAAGGIHDGVLGWSSAEDQTAKLASKGEVDVDVELFAGPVTVVSDDAATETTVAIKRVGTFDWGADKTTDESLSDIHYTISLQRNDGRDVAVVRASTEHPEPHFQYVEVTVKVPQLGSVRVHSTRGDVWIEQNHGPVDIVTSRGAIRVMTPWKMSDPMTLITCDGDVDLRIRGESSGSFDAATIGGAVKSRVRFGKWLAIDDRNNGATLHATLNDGKNPVVMRTSNADLMISVIADPVSSNPFRGIW
jgi:hypothetical protein